MVTQKVELIGDWSKIKRILEEIDLLAKELNIKVEYPE